MQVTADLEAVVADAAARVGPSVVGLGRYGSGVITAAGRVLTVAHVLRGEDADVRFGDGEPGRARVAGVDAAAGIAVLELDTGGRPAVAWEPARVAELGIGAPVLALADPGGRGLRVTLGFVSTEVGASLRGPRGRRMPGRIEHTAPLPRGSAGGPLVAPGGHLLGLNAVRRAGGLVVALPADGVLMERTDALARGEVAPAPPRLGVAIAPSRVARRIRAAAGLEPRDGLLVRGVATGSRGEAAGLRTGDLLLAAGARPLVTPADLLDALEAQSGPLTLRVLRGVEEREVVIAPYFSS